LTADGSSSPSSSPIRFTTANGSPAAGQWIGVYFRTGSSGTLRYATVEYAGAGSGTQFGVRVDTTTPLSWDHVTLNQDQGAGLQIQVASASVTITNSNFTNKSVGAGVTNNGAGAAVNASNSWWGSTTGPTVASNLGGTGDVINGSNIGGVIYSPFATSPN